MRGVETEGKWAFWDSVHRGKQLSKQNCKPHRRAVHRIMSPDEVIRKVAELGGPTVSRATLTNWERWGLISRARRGSSGRGKGRWTDYPDGTEFEAYASGMLFSKGIKTFKALYARKVIAKRNMEKDPYLDIFQGFTIKQITRKIALSARRVGQAILEGSIKTEDFQQEQLKNIWEAENHTLRLTRDETRRLIERGEIRGEIEHLLLPIKLRREVYSLMHGAYWAALYFHAREKTTPYIEAWMSDDEKTYIGLLHRGNFDSLGVPCEAILIMRPNI